jgi:hypothetical protein
MAPLPRDHRGSLSFRWQVEEVIKLIENCGEAVLFGLRFMETLPDARYSA